MKKPHDGGLYHAMYSMVVLPMIILSAVIFLFCVRHFRNAIYVEVAAALEDVCKLTLAAFDTLYEGEFRLEGDKQKVFYKGDTALNENYDIVNRMKDQTGVDVSIIYYDTRILTTLKDEDGKVIAGTGVNAVVMRDVFRGGVPNYYPDVDVKGNSFFAYYMPLKDNAGTIIGMVAAAKPTDRIQAALYRSILPMLALILVTTFLAGFAAYRWAKRMVGHINKMRQFMVATAAGDFSAVMPYEITKREDELGFMANTLVNMRGALQNLVERDVLTTLLNRRFGEKCLKERIKAKDKQGLDFCIAIGDIDFFKKVNDTYGHDAGDAVLRMVSLHLKKQMLGNGNVARWGGEEFLLIFEKSFEESKEILNAILEELRNKEVEYGDQTIRVTMSFGLAEAQAEDNADRLLKEADDYLYTAKENGRNRIESQ